MIPRRGPAFAPSAGRAIDLRRAARHLPGMLAVALALVAASAHGGVVQTLAAGGSAEATQAR